MKIYLVGGAVRDQLLGLPVRERDWVVVGATPEELLAQGFRQVGKDFPVFLHPRTHEEYALARRERKTGAGYTGFSFQSDPGISLEDDLRRRDLSINAMAEDGQGNLIDPYGGRADLEARVLRHVSPAFAEDPVRILRCARFAARYSRLGFQVAPQTMELMRTIVADGELEHLVAERIWQESRRALAEDHAQVFIRVLRQCGALAVVLPELDALFGVPQRSDYHPEVDTGLHVLMVLEQAVRLSGRQPVRFAALLHDLGKGLTPHQEWPRHKGHEHKGLALVKGVCERLKVPKEYRELALLVCEFHGVCHRVLELRPETLLRKLEALDGLRRPQRFAEFLLACEADFRGRPGFEERPYPQAGYFAGALECIAGISPESLKEMGQQEQGRDVAPRAGKELGEALRRGRLQALKHHWQAHRA